MSDAIAKRPEYVTEWDHRQARLWAYRSDRPDIRVGVNDEHLIRLGDEGAQDLLQSAFDELDMMIDGAPQLPAPEPRRLEP
jgi:hypothetical protein